MTLIGLGVILLIVGIVAYLLGAREPGSVILDVGKWVIIVAIALLVILAILGALDVNTGVRWDFD